MGDLQSKLAGVDQALAELGKSEDEVSDVRGRHRGDDPSNLGEVDATLNALSDGVPLDTPRSGARFRDSAAAEAASEAPSAAWDEEDTEIEIMDESDFVLLVDENDLEALEKVGEEDAQAIPTAIPEASDVKQEDGFFKKLFGNRGSRPPQPS